MSLKRTLLRLAGSAGLNALARRATARQLRILCYHGMWLLPGEPFGECLFITPEQFERRMERLKRSGRPVLPLAEAVERLAADDLPEASVVITIDDGWASTFTHMLPVLERLELSATLYASTWYSGRGLPVVNVAVAWLVAAARRTDLNPAAITAGIEKLPVGERRTALRRFAASLHIGDEWLELRQFELMSPEELAEARRRGLDVQLHTHRHIDLATEIDALPQEIEENRAFLRAVLGDVPLDHFCNPSGSDHPRARAMLAAAGIKSATLTAEGLNAPGADPLALRRLLDGRRVSDAEFDAYLAGTLHYLSRLRGSAGPRAAPAPPPRAPTQKRLQRC